MAEITAERIREVYNETKPTMPANAALVLEVERRLRQRRAIGEHSVGRTRDELIQVVCEDMAREASPRARAEAHFNSDSTIVVTRTKVANGRVLSPAEAEEAFKPHTYVFG